MLVHEISNHEQVTVDLIVGNENHSGCICNNEVYIQGWTNYKKLWAQLG